MFGLKLLFKGITLEQVGEASRQASNSSSSNQEITNWKSDTLKQRQNNIISTEENHSINLKNQYNDSKKVIFFVFFVRKNKKNKKDIL